jgi:hypothetical protein
MAVPVRLKVCALVGREAVEFEKDVPLPRVPFAGQALDQGRLGVSDPLHVASVEYSAVFQCHVVRCEDDDAVEVGDADALAAAYARAGWREARRVSLGACPPHKGRRAS